MVSVSLVVPLLVLAFVCGWVARYEWEWDPMKDPKYESKLDFLTVAITMNRVNHYFYRDVMWSIQLHDLHSKMLHDYIVSWRNEEIAKMGGHVGGFDG